MTEQTMSKEQREKERWDIAKIMADNFHINGEGWDESDFEWTAHCLQMAGFRKQSENVVEVVRCRDCKFNVANMERDPLDITDYSGDDIVCSYFMSDGLDPMDYCSYGAKMKGGAE